MKTTEVFAKSFKQLKIINNISGRELSRQFKRTPSYFSKLENAGEIRSVELRDVLDFITYCISDEKKAIEILLQNARQLTTNTEDWMEEIDNYYTQNYSESCLKNIDFKSIGALNNNITNNLDFAIKLNSIFDKLSKFQELHPDYTNQKVDNLVENINTDVSFIVGMLGISIDGISRLDREDKSKTLKDIKQTIVNNIKESSRKISMYD
jgi:hypothetical protein